MPYGPTSLSVTGSPEVAVLAGSPEDAVVTHYNGSGILVFPAIQCESLGGYNFDEGRAV